MNLKEDSQYYSNAIEWYNNKYINPLYQRSIVFLFSSIASILLIILLINIYNLLPIIKKAGILLETKRITKNRINITKLNENHSPKDAIALNLIEHYVVQREQYSYDNLKEQMLFIKNNSSTIVFRNFYRYLSLENNSSPVLLYRKDKFRNIKVLNIKKIDNYIVEVEYRASVIDNNLGKIEDQIWVVNISYYMEELNQEKFSFYITEYNPKLVKNLLVK